MNASTFFLGARCPATLRVVALPKRGVWSEVLPQGTRICCERGILWLTQNDDLRDYILRAGETWTTPQRGHVVVQALETASWSVEKP